MFLPNRFYYATLVVVVLLTGGYVWPPLFALGRVALVLLVLLVLADIVLLWRKQGIEAMRHCSSRFSNGDDNEVTIRVDSTYRYPVKLEIIDEIPHIFQRRDVSFALKVPAGSGATLSYRLRPTQRGVYGFGRIRLFASTPLGLVQRRFTRGEAADVAVYPSYLMLNNYELLAMSNNLTELGIKRIRRVGNNTEFEQIKAYVQGDDYRTINWKATARAHQLMVNVYTDERSQQIFNVIDKGRVMQQAFEGMTLLDYAINASLVLSYVALRRDDKAGVITFDAELDDFVPAEKRASQMQNILECLYSQQTDFGESDYSALCVNVNRLIAKRSLMILYTNFFDLISLKRQLPYLTQLNRRHRLLVVFFQDEERKAFVQSTAHSTEECYQQIIAEKLDYEQRLIVSTLREHGIYSLLTTPKQLSVDVINKYIEMKTRQLF